MFILLTILLSVGVLDSFSIIDYEHTWPIVVIVIQVGAIGFVYIITFGINFIMSLYQDSYTQREYLASILQSVNDGISTKNKETDNINDVFKESKKIMYKRKKQTKEQMQQQFKN